MSNEIKCPRCKKLNPEGTEFCVKCCEPLFDKPEIDASPVYTENTSSVSQGQFFFQRIDKSYFVIIGIVLLVIIATACSERNNAKKQRFEYIKNYVELEESVPKALAMIDKYHLQNADVSKIADKEKRRELQDRLSDVVWASGVYDLAVRDDNYDAIKLVPDAKARILENLDKKRKNAKDNHYTQKEIAAARAAIAEDIRKEAEKKEQEKIASEREIDKAVARNLNITEEEAHARRVAYSEEIARRNALAVVKWGWEYNKYGNAYLTGLIQNNSEQTFSYVEIDFNLYDKHNSQVGSTMANVNNLEPHGKWRFSAPVLENNAYTAKITNISGW